MIATKETGSLIRKMASVDLSSPTETSSLATLRTTKRTEMERKNSNLGGLSLKASGKMVEAQVKVPSCTQKRTRFTAESAGTVSLTASGNSLQSASSTSASSKMATSTVLEKWKSSLDARSTTVNSRRTCDMETVFSLTRRMAYSMKVAGRMTSSMARVS